MSEVNIMNEAGNVDTVAIRESFKDTMGRDLRMTDDVLTMVITKAGKRWDDFENADDPEKAACDFLVIAENAVAEVSAAEQSNPEISELVSHFDDEIETEIVENLSATERAKAASVYIYAQLRRIWTLDQFNSTPRPGTEEDDVSDNEKADIVKTTTANGTPITTKWWDDFVHKTGRGKQVENEMDEIAKEIKVSGSVPRLAKYSKKELKSMLGTVTARRNALRSMFKRAASLHHTLKAIEGMPGVVLEWIEHSDGIRLPVEYGKGHDCDHLNVSTSPKPFWMYPKNKPSEGKEFSVTQIINMKVEAAKLEGGSMADLVATLTKGAGDDTGTGDDSGDGSDFADDVAQAALSQVFNWFNKKENVALVLRKAANRKADADGNDWIELVNSLDQIIHPMAKKFQSAFEEIINRQLPEEKDVA